MMNSISMLPPPIEASTPHDGALIAASLTTPATFGDVFERHFDVIHRYIARRYGVDVADDATAAVFDIAFSTRVRFDADRSDARPWLYGIATNVLRRHARQEAAQWKAFARHGGGDVTVSDHPRLDEVAIAAALQSISSDDRDALLLLAWADLTYQEIADALDVPIGTVRSRIYRARTKLRVALEDLR